jgi:hypothetical protein
MEEVEDEQAALQEKCLAFPDLFHIDAECQLFGTCMDFFFCFNLFFPLLGTVPVEFLNPARLYKAFCVRPDPFHENLKYLQTVSSNDRRLDKALTGNW